MPKAGKTGISGNTSCALLLTKDKLFRTFCEPKASVSPWPAESPMMGNKKEKQVLIIILLAMGTEQRCRFIISAMIIKVNFSAGAAKTV